MKFNTAIAAMMATVNTIYELGKITKDELKIFARLLAPFAPHLAEEIYSELGETELISLAKWPEYDESKTVDNEIEMPVQINGKVKCVITVSKDLSREAVLDLLHNDDSDPQHPHWVPRNWWIASVP